MVITELESEILRFVANVKLIHREPLQHALKYQLKGTRRARTDGQMIRHRADHLVKQGLLAKSHGANYHLTAKGRAWANAQFGFSLVKPGLGLLEHDLAISEVIAKLWCAVAESSNRIEWFQKEFRLSLDFPYSAAALDQNPDAKAFVRINPDYFFAWRFPTSKVAKAFYVLEVYREPFDTLEIAKRLNRFSSIALELRESHWWPLFVLAVVPENKLTQLQAWAGNTPLPELFLFTHRSALSYAKPEQNLTWLGVKGPQYLVP